MTIRIKDPGSAFTHFIGMLMAVFASTPLLIKASRQPDRIHMIAFSIWGANLHGKGIDVYDCILNLYL